MVFFYALVLSIVIKHCSSFSHVSWSLIPSGKFLLNGYLNSQKSFFLIHRTNFFMNNGNFLIFKFIYLF
jgi:hypothetical protein